MPKEIKSIEKPKGHHFVPRWYLAKFANPQSGFLHVYDKSTKHWRKQKPNKVMKINRYYEQKHAPPNVDPNILEKSLGEYLEPRAKDAFEKLLSQPKYITAEDTAAISVYLELQRNRVPRQSETAKQFLLTIMHIFLLNGPQEVVSAITSNQVKITVKDAFRFGFMHMMTKVFAPYFLRMEWDIVTAEEGCRFITSDSPVTFFNVDVSPPFEPGLALAGTKVFFPLDSQHLLWLRHPEHINDKAVSPIAKVSEAHLEEDGFIIARYEKEWNEEQVCSLNWLILELSDRIVVGNSKEVIERAIRLP